MFNFTDTVRFIAERLDKATDQSDKFQILRYAIIAEARGNNDIVNIVVKGDINDVVNNYPAIFGQFSTSTADLLLSIGVPAKTVFGDKDFPKEKDLEQIDEEAEKGNNGWEAFFEQKTSSELYEFYIRKCNLLKSLYNANALSMSQIRLTARCNNIATATRILCNRLRDAQNRTVQ